MPVMLLSIILLVQTNPIHAQTSSKADTTYVNETGELVLEGRVYLTLEDTVKIYPYIDNEVSVTFKPDVSNARIEEIVREFGLVIVDRPQWDGGIFVLCLQDSALSIDVANMMRSYPEIGSAYPLIGKQRRTDSRYTAMANQLIVELKNGAPISVLDELNNRLGVSIFQAEFSSFYRVTLPPDSTFHVLDVATLYYQYPQVRYAEPNLFTVAFLANQFLYIPGDFDRNGIVGFSDFLLFLQHYDSVLKCLIPEKIYDLNNDWQIDFADFTVFASQFGKKAEAW